MKNQLSMSQCMNYHLGVASAFKDYYRGKPFIFLLSQKSDRLWKMGYSHIVSRIWTKELDSMAVLARAGKRRSKVSRHDTPDWLLPEHEGVVQNTREFKPRRTMSM